MLLTDVIKEVWIRYRRGKYHIIADPLANAKGYKKLYLADHTRDSLGRDSYRERKMSIDLQSRFDRMTTGTGW